MKKRQLEIVRQILENQRPVSVQQLMKTYNKSERSIRYDVLEIRDQLNQYGIVLKNISGEGYYISDGKVIPIKWEKDASASYVDYTTTDGYIDEGIRSAAPGEFGTTQYFTEDGQPLKLNPGKTFVTIFPDDKKDGITLE